MYVQFACVQLELANNLNGKSDKYPCRITWSKIWNYKYVTFTCQDRYQQTLQTCSSRSD